MIKKNSEFMWDDAPAPKATSQSELGLKKTGLHKTVYEGIRIVRKTPSPAATRIANLRSRSTLSVGKANTEIKRKARPMTRKENEAVEAVQK